MLQNCRVELSNPVALFEVKTSDAMLCSVFVPVACCGGTCSSEFCQPARSRARSAA
uniref:Uncharacterized protein n=1 Tax=mine drainage metagenome TaxID=410659 RepID=E6QN53_9ZZZZ